MSLRQFLNITPYKLKCQKYKIIDKSIKIILFISFEQHCVLIIIYQTYIKIEIDICIKYFKNNAGLYKMHKIRHITL